MRRFVSILLAVAALAVPAPALAAPSAIPIANPPAQIPIPPGPPTPAVPRPGAVTISTVITQSRLHALGLRVSLRLPRGSDTVQITIRRGNRIVVRAVRTHPRRVFRVTEAKRLRRGRYTFEIRVGPSVRHLGPRSRISFVVR